MDKFKDAMVSASQDALSGGEDKTGDGAVPKQEITSANEDRDWENTEGQTDQIDAGQSRQLREDLMTYYVAKGRQIGLEPGVEDFSIVEAFMEKAGLSGKERKELLRYVHERFSEDAYRFVEQHERAEKIAKEGPEEKKVRLVEEAQSVDDLKAAIANLGMVKGADRSYGSIDLLDIVDEFMRAEIPANMLTRQYGLREKAVEIRRKQFDRDIAVAGNFDQLYDTLKKMIDAGELIQNPNKFFGMIGKLRRGEKLDGDARAILDGTPRYIKNKIQDFLGGRQEKSPSPKEHIFRTPRGDVKGYVKYAQPGGPYIIETGHGFVEVDRLE